MNSSYHHGDLRRALIDAAVESLGETGPSALSLRAVAKRAGVSHAAPAHHFGDKAGLLTAVATEGYGRFADALERAGRNGDFVDVGVAYVRFAIDNRPYFEIMFRPELLHEDDPDLARAESRSRSVLVRGAADLAGGEPSLSPQAVAAWSMVHGFAELLIGGNFPPEVAGDPEATVRKIATRIRFDPE
ncbi:TetR/AcrR family transcriptional regulator [Glycomyces salinus]|uniref:TetR/AcrR family transcriptional regulator n=1 Tax=Glycomyces salinus TaxID=980294 RepID=UPI0018EC948C|nr:TetR/AcrR family transcriptional regulator [Glycomyces salinus]